MLMDSLPITPAVNYHVCGDEKSLQKQFSSNTSCALYAFPFREFDYNIKVNAHR